MNETTKGDKMSTKQYVTKFQDGSYGKDRRITKLVSDIKKLSELKTDNQIMKVTWKDNYLDNGKWYECVAYDHDFSYGIDDNAPSGLVLEKDGQGWIQQLELIDRWGFGHHWENDMSECYKDLKVELIDVPAHEEYVAECELCVEWTGGMIHGMQDACLDTWF